MEWTALSQIKVYNNNKSLKASNVELQYTKEQIQEFLRCGKDPLYFIKNYAKIVSLDEGVIQFDPFPYQERVIEAIHDNPSTLVKLFRQAGKCLSGETKLKVRNKINDEEMEITIEEFFKMSEKQNERKNL